MKPPIVPPASRASITAAGWSFTTRCITFGVMKWLSICWATTMTTTTRDGLARALAGGEGDDDAGDRRRCRARSAGSC